MPENVIGAGFQPGGVKAIDSVTLCSWIAIRISMDEAGKLAAAIRERKLLVYGPSGNNSGLYRARGGAGSQRRALEYKTVATRLKTRAKELWGWVRTYNTLAEGLADQFLLVVPGLSGGFYLLLHTDSLLLEEILVCDV